MLRQRQIAVAPVDGGWSVACDGWIEPIMFLSGARAECQARTLARRLSDAGGDVEVTVRDRSSVLIGSTRYSARETA